MRLAATLIPKDSWLIRIHEDESPNYSRMIIVCESEDFKNIHLYGWIGKPLTPKEWVKYGKEYFPFAETVSFERLREDGSFKNVTLNLR